MTNAWLWPGVWLPGVVGMTLLRLHEPRLSAWLRSQRSKVSVSE